MVPLSVLARFSYNQVSDGCVTAGDQQHGKDTEWAYSSNHSNSKVVMATEQQQQQSEPRRSSSTDASAGKQNGGEQQHVIGDYPMTVVDLDTRDHMTSTTNSNSPPTHTNKLSRIPSGQLDNMTRGL